MAVCPVCLSVYSAPASVSEEGGGLHVNCPSCGQFAVEEEAWKDYLRPNSHGAKSLTNYHRARLSYRINRTRIDQGVRKPKIYSSDIEGFIADGCPGPNPSEQAANIIKFVGDEISRTGERLPALPQNLYAIVGSGSPDFARSLVFELKQNGWLDGVEQRKDNHTIPLSAINLSLAGWERYEAERRGRFSGSYGFLALKFGVGQLDSFINDVLKPSIREGIGYELVDMRDVSRAGIIDNLMRSQIRDSSFVIADLTHDNPGAYWEAGYAEGLGKPVVYICEKAKFSETKTHFDTNHCTTVLWSNQDSDDFRKEIVATLRRSLNLFSDR